MADCSLPGSSVRGISQARILECTVISYARGSSWPRDRTHVSWLSGYSLPLSHLGSPVQAFRETNGSGGMNVLRLHCSSFMDAVLPEQLPSGPTLSPPLPQCRVYSHPGDARGRWDWRPWLGSPLTSHRSQMSLIDQTGLCSACQCPPVSPLPSRPLTNLESVSSWSGESYQRWGNMTSPSPHSWLLSSALGNNKTSKLHNRLVIWQSIPKEKMPKGMSNSLPSNFSLLLPLEQGMLKDPFVRNAKKNTEKHGIR